MTPKAALARPVVRAALAAFVVLFLVGFAPLFGPPGYEHALAAGLVAPSCAAIGVALELSRIALPPRDQLLRAMGAGAGIALAAYAWR